MSALRFNVGLQSAIRNFRAHNMGIEDMGTDERGATPSATYGPNAERRRGEFGRFVLWLLRPIRRALVGHIETQINEFQSYQSELLINLHLKFDESQARAKLGALDEIKEQINLLLRRMDDIGLRVRGPIQVDETTFSLRTYDGFVFVPGTDTLLLLLLLDAGPQGLEPGTRTILTKLLTPGMTFIDVGAHIGLLTLAGARVVENSGKVYALEPTSRGFELLNRALFREWVEQPRCCKMSGCRRSPREMQILCWAGSSVTVRFIHHLSCRVTE